MKKILVCIIILMLLLCACQAAQTDPSISATDPSGSQQTDPTTPSETQGSEPEGTQPQSGDDSTMSVAAWQVEKPEYLTYEAYFSVSRDISAAADSWINDNCEFTVKQLLGTWVVSCQETNLYYKIPNASAYLSYNLLGADGWFGYLKSEGTVLRIDLATGETEQVLHESDYESASFILADNLVLYYFVYASDTLEIGRVYLPELKHDSLYKAEGEFYNIALQSIKNTTEPLSLTMMNPDFIELLKTELADPNSQYQLLSVSGSDVVFDYTRYWSENVDLFEILKEPAFLHRVQDASGIRALLKCMVDPEDGSVTRKTGVIDNCFHGSSMPHDHYDPEITTAPVPEVIMSQWSDLENPLPDIIDTQKTGVEKLLLPDVDSNRYLYAKIDGAYRKAVDVPVSWAVDTGKGFIYISADKRSIYAVDSQNGQPVEIYRSAVGDITAPDRSQVNMWLIVRDGDTLVQIDLAAGKSRQLVRHQNIQPYYYIDGKSTVYFEISAGMYGTGYTIDLESGELDEDFRL